ncbi:MAG TPA: GNAT family N-acetyltransferase [Candidatus Dormibacteraeota bacterium]|jgi:CRP-like cAMP-binding protein|nr:GNAT family N-acetyltransferase [Candidatus Dormibacteraeota bacterium]
MPLFEGAEGQELGSFASRLETRELAQGDVLMAQGEESRFFAIVVDGDLRVSRRSPDGGSQEITVGAPSVIGELAMLTGQPRTATVTTITPAKVLTGGAGEFQLLLELPGLQNRLQRVVSGRLAEHAVSVSAELPDGTPVLLHPLRASDREDFIAAYENLSLKSLENRFFSGGQPPRSLIEYLLRLDYVNHFAWVVVDPAAPEGGLAEARYVRLGASPDTADIALTVTDAYQGRGIGSLLMGALGAAAGAAGIERFSADVRGENGAMLGLLKKAEAVMGPYEQGVVNGIVSADRAAMMVPDGLRLQLQRVASDLVTAAGLGMI